VKTKYVVELRSGEDVRKPLPFPLGDCRTCSLLSLVCNDDEYPCDGALEMYRREHGLGSLIDVAIMIQEGRVSAEEVVLYKPCCWRCPFLADCLEAERSWLEEYVKARYRVEWEEFKRAVLELREPED
jgi:hypothetical protein